MKRFKNISIILILLGGKCFSQNHAIDSIRLVLAHEKDDTGKVNTLNLLASKFYKNASYDSALQTLSRAQDLAIKTGFKKGLADAYSTFASTYSFKSRYPEAIDYANKAIDLSKKINYTACLASSLNVLGLTYMGIGNYPKALEAFFPGLETFKKSGNKKGMSSCLGNIGLIYYAEGNYPKALEYDSLALSVSTEAGYVVGTAIIEGNIGLLYQDKNNFSKALEYYMQSLALNLKAGYKIGIATNYSNLSGIYDKEGDYPKSLEYNFKSLKLFQGVGKSNDVATLYVSIGNTYYKEKNYVLSKRYYDSALHLSLQIGTIGTQGDIYMGYSKIDSAQGDYKNAWNNYKKYIFCRDSLNNQATVRKTTQAEMNFDFTHKTDSVKAAQDKLNVVAEQEKARQKVIRNAFIGGFSLALIASGIFFFQRRRLAEEKKLLNESNAVKDKLFSIISHDLRSPFNTLNGMLGFFRRGKISAENSERLSQNLENSMQNTLNLLDNLLSWSHSQLKGFTIKNEKLKLDEIALEIISLYSGAAKQKEITIEMDFPEGMEIEADKNIMKLVMRNLVNNAVKFSRTGGKILISAIKENGYWGFSVKDNGIGIPAGNLKTLFNHSNTKNTREGTANEPGSGLGLALCHELIASSGGELKAESAEGKGTTMVVVFQDSSAKNT